MIGISNLTNAALEFIEERQLTLEKNDGNRYSPEDIASVLRERQCILREIAQIEHLRVCAQAIAKMKHPSVERLLRARGFDYEADRVADLVLATDAMLTEVTGVAHKQHHQNQANTIR